MVIHTEPPIFKLFEGDKCLVKEKLKVHANEKLLKTENRPRIIGHNFNLASSSIDASNPAITKSEISSKKMLKSLDLQMTTEHSHVKAPAISTRAPVQVTTSEPLRFQVLTKGNGPSIPVPSFSPHLQPIIRQSFLPTASPGKGSREEA